MCGRYLIDDETSSQIEILMHNAPGGTLGYAIGEIFPTNIAPVITHSGILPVKWGFPHWKNSSVIINAKAETAEEKSMFRKALLEQRCVIPSSGYYEWAAQSGHKSKIKYLLQMPDEGILYMAGMIRAFRDASGSEYFAFVILTTEASSTIAHLHNRMPVVLMHNEQNQWLNDSSYMEHVLHRTGPQLSYEAT